jgi:hypothetical protein
VDSGKNSRHPTLFRDDVLSGREAKMATEENSGSLCQNSFAKQSTIYRIGHSRTLRRSKSKPVFHSETAAKPFHFCSRVYRLAAAPLPV